MTWRQWAWCIWHSRPFHSWGLVLLGSGVYCGRCGSRAPD